MLEVLPHINQLYIVCYVSAHALKELLQLMRRHLLKRALGCSLPCSYMQPPAPQRRFSGRI